MKFLCVNNQDVEDLLTVGKQYTGEYNPASPKNMAWPHVKIFRCNDKHEGFFQVIRFEIVQDLDTVPNVKINSYAMEAERK